MNEVSGRGFYPGPSQHQWPNKTDYGIAVWHPLKPHRTAEQQQQEGQHDDQQQPISSRQGPHASGVDGSLLTELLGCMQLFSQD